MELRVQIVHIVTDHAILLSVYEYLWARMWYTRRPSEYSWLLRSNKAQPADIGFGGVSANSQWRELCLLQLSHNLMCVDCVYLKHLHTIQYDMQVFNVESKN